MELWRFVFLAYGIVGLTLVLYVLGLWRRLGRALDELSALQGAARNPEAKKAGKSTAPAILLFLLTVGSSAWSQATAPEEIFQYITRDGPTLGNTKAPITLIELSDFQCSFCRKFWRETLPLIDKNHIQTGRVRLIYHHFAILGKFSTAAAEGAECAGEQGKFWQFHDQLFSNGGSPFAFTQERLKGYARDVGLIGPEFHECLASGKYNSKIESETAMSAYLGARGTPAFFLNGVFVAGAQSYSVFDKLLQEEWKRLAGKDR